MGLEVPDDGGSKRQPEPGAPPPPGRDFVRIGLLFYGVMLGAALIWRMGFSGESILYASPEAAQRDVGLVSNLALGVVAGGLVVIVSNLITQYTGWGEALARSLAASLAGLSVPDALLLALASGMGEEFFFRGALQPRVGLVLASLLFGCVHFVPRRDFLPWTGFAVVAGFIFGGLFEWTGNLVAPVAAHVVVNGINLPLLLRRYGSQPGGGAPRE